MTTHEEQKVTIVNGQLMPPHPLGLNMEQHAADILSMTLRDDDVFICAYPKTGTHWLWEVCYMLLQGKVQYEQRAKEYLMMEFMPVEALKKEKLPRIFNTHLYFASLPVGEMIEKRVKILHVYRNPKDVVVSKYFHFSQMPILRNTTMRDFIQMFLRGQAFFGDYATYLQQMEKFIKENPEVPVLNVSFEETKRDPVGVVRRLAGLLQVDASEKLCEDIAVACSFQKMKMVDETLKIVPEAPGVIPVKTLYRKGEVGDWKNYLTVAESEMIDKYIEEGLKDCTLFKLEYE